MDWGGGTLSTNYNWLDFRPAQLVGSASFNSPNCMLVLKSDIFCILALWEVEIIIISLSFNAL